MASIDGHYNSSHAHGRKEYPCPSELHTFFQKIPKEWLEKALLRLDELSAEEFSKFSEPLDIFVIDGSALTGETLVEREVLTKIRLIRDYFEYQATIRTFTNTIRCVNYHSNKIADIIPFLPEDAEERRCSEIHKENSTLTL